MKEWLIAAIAELEGDPPLTDDEAFLLASSHPAPEEPEQEAPTAEENENVHSD